ncbi:MAG: Molybdenum cofactor biosynthesis protein MoaE [Brockia lithotrophica]|uniref:Molybdenum cofactor biosynthesis protein MoaE n=1 Tax=Brockia lithotrophica TaxID=933949 RepID=A0A2T5G4J5_9BACL|nr:molybdenum cofactor biosynthesis protein MoaE [Brockia lithotrophica]PTQ51104.1 MAG: Molybdenum cofactor biosynthesis protein MoaE [Brockia lithotrophica]
MDQRGTVGDLELPLWREVEWGRFGLVREPIDPGPLLEFVTRPEMGAVVLFLGVGREWTEGRRTLSLSYEAYESMALKTLEEIGGEVRARWPEVRMAVVHRLGPIAISEASVAIATASPHRAEAYAANRYVIDRVKEITPIWKKEHREDGEAWILGHTPGVSPKGR